MNEVEKMYENSNIKPKQKGYCDWDSNCPYPHHKCNDECPFWKYENEAKYPPLTAEKQLELIKWLMNYPMLDELSLFFNEPSKTFNLRVYSLPEINDFRSTYTETQNNFEDMLCGLINNLWQDLTDAEKAQIKEILE